jgi:hypothetical protein
VGSEGTRPRPDDCDHASAVLVNSHALISRYEERGAYHVRCLICGAVGPPRETSGEAIKAIGILAPEMRDSNDSP